MDRKNIITPNQTIHILLAMKKKFIRFNTSVYGKMPRYIKLNLVQSLLTEAKEKIFFDILSQSRNQGLVLINSVRYQNMKTKLRGFY